MRQLLARGKLTLWGIRLTLVLLLVATLGSGVVYAQEGPDVAETELSGEPTEESADAPERTRVPLAPVDTIYVAEVAVATAAQLEQLLAMGYACADLGACRLEVSGDELSALKEAGLEVVVVEQAIKFSTEAPEAAAMAEAWRYGWNGGNIWIPDGAGSAGSGAVVGGAPAGSVVTRIRYEMRIVHTYPGDLVVKLGHDNPARYITIWNRLGGTDDGGFDDDAASDEDIFLNNRWENVFFDGDFVNQTWWMYAWDKAAVDTGYIDYIEVWVYYNVGNNPPFNGAINPNNGGAACGTIRYFVTYHYDNDGCNDLKACRFHVGRNSAPKSLAGNAVFNYHVPSNTLRIRNNNGTKWWGGRPVGSMNVVQNNQAKVYCNLTTVTRIGNMIRVRWAVEFKCTFRGGKKMYLKTRDRQGAAAPLKQKGTWTVW